MPNYTLLAIQSPKFSNLLKFYPRAQNVRATFYDLFRNPECRFSPCCKLLQCVRAESGYQVH